MIARRLVIHGRVQGVFYRGWAVGTARTLALTGWVRNRRNGTVEAVVEGDPSAVARFIELARNGPPHAQVERIDASEIEPDGSLAEFRQEATV